jgi:glycine oxidase
MQSDAEVSLASHYDLAVLGGGVVGLSIAVQCAKLGWRVCVVERGQVGKEASWAGAGILPAGATVSVDDPIEQLRQLSDRLHEEWAAWLLDFTQIDNEYRRSGGLYLARSPAERATLRGNCIWWEEHGIGYRKLSMHEVCNLSATIAPIESYGSAGEYYWIQRDAKLRNPRHVAALKAACRKLEIDLFEHTEVLELNASGSTIESVECTSDLHEGHRMQMVAQRYCLTTGAWTAQLLKPLGIETGIYPVRGQMQLYRFDQIPFPCVINEGHRYMVPREDGRVLVGSCEEEVGFVKATTQEMMEQLKDWAVSVCPKLAHATLESQWSGLRPGSIDAFPYLGTLYPHTNGFIAAGHFRHGLHWSTATALLMGQHMQGESTAIDLEPFRLHRGNVQ